MKYTAVVEIPKDCDRRIHKSNETGEFIDFGSIKDLIPINEGRMPVYYGYLKGVINPVEGDEVDVLIFSETYYKTGDEVIVEVLGLLEREDGDHKLICRDGSFTVDNMQEINKTDWILVMGYFGFKSPIISIKNSEQALTYIQNCPTA